MSFVLPWPWPPRRPTFEQQVFEELSLIRKSIQEIEKHMSSQQDQMNTDSARLLAVAKTGDEILAAIKTIKEKDAATIEDLQKQIEDLKANNPAVDFTGLEENITILEANAAAILGATTPTGA